MMGTPAEEVEFSDAELQECYDRQRGSIEFAENIRMLDCDRQGIRDLSGIEILTGLETLDLEANPQLGGLSALSGLSNLRNLYLGECDIDNEGLQVVAMLVGLRDLEMFGNNLGDISALANLVNVRRLLLSASGITDGVASLVTLENVISISLASNPDSPCGDLETLIAALPEVDIVPDPPEADKDCQNPSGVVIERGNWSVAE